MTTKIFTKNFFLALVALLGIQAGAQAQRFVTVASDPLALTDLFPIIMGDTTATGERVDNNTIYVLDNGGAYATSGRLVNKKIWPLQIQASDLSNTAIKPVITRIPNGSGTYPDLIFAEGDLTIKNVWLIIGERAAGQEHDFGRLRVNARGVTVRMEDCILEKERGGFIQLRADSAKLFINRCVMRNGGNRKILQGNGRAIDARNFIIDTLMFTNNTVHNLIDRAFRSQGAIAPHNYLEFDHNTFFNIAGRHGCIQLGRVNTVKITDNIFMNPLMLGTSPIYTDEQTQPDNESHKVFTMDTIYAATNITMRGNNVFWTQDVIDVWNGIDSVSRPNVLSQLIKQVLGADTATAYFEEVITLPSVPMNITQYVIDLYANPAATNMFDFIVEDLSLAGTGYDFGNLFDFATFDICYDTATVSAKSSVIKGAIGNTTGCDDLLLLDISEKELAQVEFKVVPNPVVDGAYITFNLPSSTFVQVKLMDLQGRTLQVLADGTLFGSQEIALDPALLSDGMYLVQMNTAAGSMIQKVIVRKN